MAVGAAPDPGVVGVCAKEAGVSVGGDAVTVGACHAGRLIRASRPRCAAVRTSARTTLNRVSHFAMCVRVNFVTSCLDLQTIDIPLYLSLSTT